MIIRKSQGEPLKLNARHNRPLVKSRLHTSDSPKTARIESRKSSVGRKKAAARTKKRSSVERHYCQRVAVEMEIRDW